MTKVFMHSTGEPRLPRGALAVGLVALALSACSSEQVSDAPTPRTVWVGQVEQLPGVNARFAGQLQAKTRSELAFEVPGRILAIHVELGDTVSKGEVLAELEDLAIRLDLASRDADLANAQAALVDARLDYERRAGLAGTGAVSRSAIDRAKARFDGAVAQVAALQAAVAQARKRLADTRLLAPFAGQIVGRLAEPSEVVATGRPVLRIIGDDSDLETIVHVPGSTIGTLAAGQRAEIQLPAFGVTAIGEIIEIGAEANGSGLFPITLAINDAPPSLRPGESVEARFVGASDETRLRIPLTAYVPTTGQHATVYVIDSVDDGERLAAKTVRLGALHDDGVDVVEGLLPGDSLVVRGADLLRDGERVRVAGLELARYNR